MNRLQKAVMLSFIAFMLLLCSFVLPWFGYNQEREREVDGETRSYSQGYGLTLPFFFSFAGGVGGATLYGGTATSILILITALFVMFSLIFMGLFLVFLLSKFMEIHNAMKVLNAVGVLALIFCIMAPIIFAVALPSAMRADAKEQQEYYGNDYEDPDHDDPTTKFFGSYEDTDEDYWDGTTTDRASWGGDIGWFLSFFAFVFFLIAMVMLSAGVRERPPMQPPYPGMPPQPSYQGAPPYQPPPPPPVQPPIQPLPYAPQTPHKSRVTCPGCKNVIEVEADSFPAPIKCPICGTSGFIE